MSVATGIVRIYNGDAYVTQVSLDANGNFTFSTNGFAPGTYNLTAQYQGDATHESAQSSILVQVVNSAVTTPNVTLNSSENPATQGDTITLSGSVV